MVRTRSLAALAAAGACACAAGLLMTVPAAMAKPPGKGVPVAAVAAAKWRDVSPRPALAGGPGPVSCATPRWCLAVGAFGSQDANGSVTWNGTRWSSRVTLLAGAQLGGLDDVSCPKDSFCLGVGAVDNAALAERWNGSRWTVTSTPRRAAELTSVSCSSPTSCTAVGIDDGLVAERWNGNRWKVQPTPSTLIQFGSFPSVSCSAARSCVAVWSGIKRFAAEFWNGTRWNLRVIHPPTGATSAYISGVSCTAPDACTAVGGYSNGRVYEAPLAERWNGRSWRMMTPAAAGDDSRLVEVSCASARSCAATGVREIKAGAQSFADVWTGGKWFVHELRTPEDPQYFADARVSCARGTAVNCMALGHSEVPSIYMWAEHYS